MGQYVGYAPYSGPCLRNNYSAARAHLMIHESRYWKQPLLVSAERLHRLAFAKSVSERKLVMVERDVFIGFYAIRKLLEAPNKLSDTTRSEKIPLLSYRNAGAKVTWRNNHKIDQLYQLSKKCVEHKDIAFVCHRMIHSYIFVPCFKETGALDGFYFTSDYDKDLKIYYLSLHDVVKTFKMVGADYPSHVDWAIDEETGKETTRAWSEP